MHDSSDGNRSGKREGRVASLEVNTTFRPGVDNEYTDARRENLNLTPEIKPRGANGVNFWDDHEQD